MNPPNSSVDSKFGLNDSSITRPVAKVFRPSSIHACSTSLLPTTPYQNWWPPSWTVTPSGVVVLAGASQRLPPVNRVGYSMPPARLCQAGSTIVRCPYGYGPNHSPQLLHLALVALK